MSTKNEKQEALNLLKEMGVAPSAANLVYHAQQGGITEIKNLVWAGIDPNSISGEGFSPLIQASGNGHKKIVEFLLNNGANPNIIDQSKYVALSKASYYGHDEIVKLLIEKGADPNGPNGVEYPPIMQAIQNEQTSTVELLIKLGVDLNKKDIQGKTPIERAFQSKNKALYERIIQLGGSPLSEDEKKALRADNGFLGVLKQVYAKNAYVFLGVNLFAFIIIFFVLDKSMGGIGIKIFAFLFCLVVGGLLGAWWSRKRDGDPIAWFRYGSGTLLVLFTLLMWANNGYKPSNNNYNSSSSGSSTSSDCNTCSWCGGQGVVGYAGQSEAQVRRTGNGLGNSCLTCGGDGCE